MRRIKDFKSKIYKGNVEVFEDILGKWEGKFL